MKFKKRDAKDVKVMSMIEVIEGGEKLENENKTLNMKALDAEEKVKKLNAELESHKYSEKD